MLSSLDATTYRREVKSVVGLSPTQPPAGSSDTALVILGLLALPIILGVVLPAVWSRRPFRRKAALEVLAQLLRRKP